MILKRLRELSTLNNAVLLAAFLLAISWMWGTMEALQKNFTLQQTVDRTAQEVELLDLEAQMLEFEKRYYESDEYLELAARARLNVAAPGEKLLILPENTVTDDTYQPQVTPAPPVDPPSNFSQWMNFFFGKKTDGDRS